MKYDDHPLAGIFPLMADADLAALADDIDANGLREPVWLFEGKILDGRNRYRACGLKDVDPRFEEYRGKDALGFVISKNLHRRHLTESQRAMVAARLANLQAPNSGAREAVTSAADALNVSPRSVDAARAVEAKGTPELVAAVEKGEVSVSAAAEVAKLPKAEQKKAVKDGTVKEKAKEQREQRKAHPAVESVRGGQPAAKKKAGAEVFRWQDFDKVYGPLVRLTGELGTAFPHLKATEDFRVLELSLEEFIGAWKKLQTRATGRGAA